MKKFTKVALIIAGVLVVIGLGCLVGSISLGMSLGDLGHMVQEGKFNFWKEERAQGEESEVDVCNNLEIQFGMGELTVQYGEVEKIQIKEEGIQFKYYVKEDTLHIEQSPSYGFAKKDGKMTVILPVGTKFDEVDIELGAGKAEIAALSVQEFEAKVGAGKMSVSLSGKESDYNYEVECGAGLVKVADSSYGGLGTEKEMHSPGATKSFSVECGAGEVTVAFTDNSI